MATLPRFYVYVLARPVKVKREIVWRVFYVGKGTNRRVFKHEEEARRGCTCHKCLTIQKVWRDGGEIQRYILLTTENEQEAFDYECEMIELHGRENLCNHDAGGRGGPNPSAETRAKMSAAHKGKRVSDAMRAKITARVRAQAEDPEWRKRVSEGTKRGQARNPDFRARKSAQMKELWADPEYHARVTKTVGDTRKTPEMRARVSEAQKRRYSDPAQRERQAAQLRALKTPENRANVGARAKELWADPEHRAMRMAAMKKARDAKKRLKERGP